MRVSTGVRRAAALLTLVVLLAVPAAYADESPYEPPQARILPPIGSSQAEPSYFDWLVIYARILPPIG